MSAVTVDSGLAVPRSSARTGARAARAVAARILTAALVLVAAASVTFFAQLLVPGDRATTILNLRTGRAQTYSAAELAPVNEKFVASSAPLPP